MATRKRTQSRSSGAWFGLVLGMVLGVGAAVAVALFVTQVPMPFTDNASRNAPQTLLPDVGNAPDPNIGLYGKDGAAGTAAGPTTTPPAGIAANTGAPAADASKNPLSDDIGKLIANLGTPKAPPPPPMTAPPAAVAPAAPKAAAPGTQTIYYLQTGAFRSRNEAETMNARVLMLGLPVHIEQAQSNGSTVNRVRVGPFKGIDEMNKARSKLGAEQIESSVVRP